MHRQRGADQRADRTHGTVEDCSCPHTACRLMVGVADVGATDQDHDG